MTVRFLLASKIKKIDFIKPTHTKPVTVRQAIGNLPPVVAGVPNTNDNLHVAPTITTQFIGYGTGRFGHPVQDIALTLREGAMIQTFPQNYSFVPQGDEVILKNIARHIGNAVPPRLEEIIGVSIKEQIESRRKYIRHTA